MCFIRNQVLKNRRNVQFTIVDIGGHMLARNYRKQEFWSEHHSSCAAFEEWQLGLECWLNVEVCRSMSYNLTPRARAVKEARTMESISTKRLQPVVVDVPSKRQMNNRWSINHWIELKALQDKSNMITKIESN